MSCANCGQKLQDHANFCGHCGQQIKTVQEAAVTNSPQNVPPIVEELPIIKRPIRKFSGKARAAGIIQITTSSLWGIITLFQIVNILQNGMGTSNLFVAVWNTVVTVYGIIEGVKLLNGLKKEARAGFRSAVVGIAWYLIQAIVWHPFVILFMFFEISIFILLLTELKSDEH
jgi:hypothetical protein